MSDRGIQFRTATFGGFRKEDVLAYLEQSSKAHTERINALQRELEQAKSASAEGAKQSSDLAEEMASLRAEWERVSDELTAATARKSELEHMVAQLQSDVEAMRPAAEAYETIKARTASIELEAHGRAQAIEEEGRQRVRVLQEEVMRWFEKVCAAYGQIRGDVDATMNHAIREMARTLQNFQDISGDFTAHDKALAEAQRMMEAARAAVERPPEPVPLDPEA